MLTLIARGSYLRPPVELAIATLLVLCSSFAGSSPAAADEADELQALFISKVALFVTWPDEAFESPEAPIRIGILGRDPSDEILTRVLAETKTEGRSYRVYRGISLEAAGRYHVLVINETRRRALREIARNLKGTSVLSIARSFDFAQDGGIIGMEMRGGKVAFQVNNRAALQADLKISSRLLRLATNVY